MSSSRRKGRECALQIMYQAEIMAQLKSTAEKTTAELSIADQLERLSVAHIDAAIEQYFNSFEAPKEVHEHAGALVKGVLTNIGKIDEAIAAHSPKWKITRMARVDRNILRIATYELLFSHDLTPNIIINEAIEIGKRFGSEQSSAFLNGVLDGIASASR